MGWQRRRDFIRTQAIYARLLWREFRVSLIAFFAVLFLGAAAIHHFYDKAALTWPEALWGAFTLIFFQPTLEFPGHWFLALLFFVIPACGVLVIVEGLLRFSLLMVNRKHNQEEWHMALAESFSGHIVISGLGKIGGRVAKMLLADGEKLVGVELNAATATLEGRDDPGLALLTGNILSDEILRRTNLAQAKCFMALTDDDLVNFESALKVRARRPDLRIVLRLFNDRLAAQMQDAFNISIVYSSSALAAPSFAAAVYSKHIRDSFEIDGERYCLLHLPIDDASPFCGLASDEIEQRFGASVVLHKDAARRKKPNRPGERVVAGDKLILILPFAAVKELSGKL